MKHSKFEIQNSKFPRYDRYKDSGVDSFGEIPIGWDVVSLCREATLKSLCNYPDRELLSVYLDRGVIRFSDVEEKRTNATSTDLSAYQAVDPGDFVLNNQQAWRGSVGVSSYQGIVSPAYMVLSLSERWNHSYANYLFRTSAMVSQYLIYSKGVGTIQRNLYYPDFKKTATIIPPKPEQDRIVGFLDQKTAEIDALIAKKQRQIELLDEQKAIQINLAVTRGIVNSEFGMKNEHLSSSSHSTFTTHNSKFSPSGIEWIGEIPEGWQVLRVKHQAIYFTSGSRGWGDFYSDEGNWFLQSGDLTNNCTISLANAKRVKLPRKAEGLRTRLQTNDTVVCITGANTGRVANVGEISETIYVNQHLCLVRPSKVIDRRYLSLALSGSAGRTHFSLCQYGLKEGLSLDDVKNCAFPVPPLSEQGEILGFIDKISAQIEACKGSVARQIQSLKTLRSTLIAHAVTGRIKV